MQFRAMTDSYCLDNEWFLKLWLWLLRLWATECGVGLVSLEMIQE